MVPVTSGRPALDRSPLDNLDIVSPYSATHLDCLDKKATDGVDREAERASPGHAGHADTEDARAGAAPRLRHRGADYADQSWHLPGQRGIALPRLPAARARRADQGRMAHHGEQPPREVVLADRSRSRATEGRHDRLAREVGR